MATLVPHNIAYDSAPFAAFNENEAARNSDQLGSAGTATDISVPSGSVVCKLVADQDLWYNFDITALAPAGPAVGNGPVFVARGSEAWFTVIGLSNISVVSTVSDTRVVGLFWTE